MSGFSTGYCMEVTLTKAVDTTKVQQIQQQVQNAQRLVAEAQRLLQEK